MRKLIAIILFLFPAFIAFPIVKLLKRNKFTYGNKSRIGFSYIEFDELHIDENVSIGSFNYIKVNSLVMKGHSKIKYFNMIKGRFDVDLSQKAIINQFCKIVSKLDNIRKTNLHIGYNSIIGVGHLIDMTHNIFIDNNTIFAGARSQVWTHGFYHPSSTIDHWRIDGQVHIGRNVYVGTNCIICAGVSITDNVTLGAGSVVSKDLKESGLYVNQPLRHLDFIPEQSIKRFHEVGENIFEK